MAQVEAHALSSGDDQVPECEDTIEDSEGGSADEISDEGAVSDGDGGSDGDADEGSDEGADEASDGEAGGGSDGEEAGDEGDESQGNAGWADAMAKILGKKTTENKGTILVKNAALDKAKTKERQEQLERKKQLDKRHAWEMLCREKPDIVRDRETEKALQRIATRGVVQLFNAVRKHQKTVDSKLKEVGGSERKKAKILTSVSKKDFIDVLRGEEGGGRGAGKADEHTAPAAEDKPAWSVLRDDYMMGATMKDWDKESDAEEAEPQA